MMNKKDYIVNTYVRLSRDGTIGYNELAKQGITKDSIKHYFLSLENLDKEARELYPTKFSNVLIDDIVDSKEDYADYIDELLGKYKKFVITTAVEGCEVHEGFYKCIKNYCTINNAKLIILLSEDTAKSNRKSMSVDTLLKDEVLILKDTRLNSNLFISSVKISAKQLDPITGFSRIGQNQGSFIFASPKQRFKTFPVSNRKLPHIMCTTGAITKPDYKTDKYMSKRTAYLADYDHKIGAIVVELEKDETFHIRRVESNNTGSFIDLGTVYHKNCTSEIQAEALVLGDWHSGETDPIVRKCTYEMAKLLNPKKFIVHDAFNGTSITHHDQHKTITKALKAEKGLLSLSEEILGLAQDFKEMLKHTEELVVVKSNHDDSLDRYLQEARYIYDSHNHKLSLELALAFLNGQSPLAYGLSKNMKIEDMLKIKFLKVDDDYKICGVQLGNHGHLGANGSRGSTKSMDSSYGKSVSGHSHSPEILRNSVVVGTSSFLKLDYNKGPSSWLQAHAVIYPGGYVQLINIIDGKWKK